MRASSFQPPSLGRVDRPERAVGVPTRIPGDRIGSGDGELGARCGSSIASIRGALVRPSSRDDRPLALHEHERRDDADAEPLRELGARVDVDAADAQPVRSLRARCASRLSIRRAGPERSDQKKTSNGRSSFTDFLLKRSIRVACCMSSKHAVETRAASTLAGDGRLVHGRSRARARRRRSACSSPALLAGDAARAARRAVALGAAAGAVVGLAGRGLAGGRSAGAVGGAPRRRAAAAVVVAARCAAAARAAGSR